MLSRCESGHLTYRVIAVLAWLGLAGCSETPSPPRWPALQTESSYRLLFNDALVAHALFSLEIDSEGRYRIEAFTTPAGSMRKAADQQILEVSSGRIENGSVRPARFDHSTLAEDGVDAVNLLFDWADDTLHLVRGEQAREVRLLPGTQDRLSYLLAARNLAMLGEGRLQLQVASSGATEENLLAVIGRGPIEVPYGTLDATGIRRVTANPGEERTLWFADAVTPLPVRVVRQRDGSTLEMQLETVVDRTQPASE